MTGKWLDRLRGRGSAAAGDDPADTLSFTASVQALGRWRTQVDVDTLYARWLLGAPRDTGGVNAAALLQRLAATLADARESLIPRVPALVPQLLHGLRDPRRSIVALSRQVAQDPVLVAAVLRRVNSPYYRGGKHIESLEQALLVIGHDGLRHLLAAVALKPLINVQSGTFTHRAAPIVWDHSERCGLACHMLALAASASPFEAFLGAMLYNVGAIVLLRDLDHAGEDPAIVASEEFCTGFAALVRHAARTVGERWRFPDDVLAAVAPAHGAAPLAHVLQASDRLGKLRILVEADQLAESDALELDSVPVLRACFDKLGALRAA